MKKKIVILLVLGAMLLALCSCTQTIQIKRFEERGLWVGDTVDFAENISYDLFLDIFLHYRENSERFGNSLYLPREGEFVTEDGEVFISRVEKVTRYSQFYSTNSGESVRFVLNIYSADETLLVSEEVYSSSKGNDTLSEVTVSEEMAPYWNIIKVSSNEIMSE